MAEAPILTLSGVKLSFGTHELFTDVELYVNRGDKIALVGFGSFSVAKKPGRTGRNPRTGAVIKIAAKNAVKFKAGAELNAQVK